MITTDNNSNINRIYKKEQKKMITTDNNSNINRIYKKEQKNDYRSQ